MKAHKLMSNNELLWYRYVPIDGAIAHLDVHTCAGIALAATTCTEDYNNFKTIGI